MVTWRTVLHTFYSRFLLLLAIIVGFPFIILMMVLPESMRYKNRFLFWGIHLFYTIVIKATWVPITFEGLETIPHEPVIFIANHQSSLDIPIVGYLVHNKPHIWIARLELMRWKLLRWVLPRVSVIVDTASSSKAMRSMIHLMRLVEDKDIDIMIFPEGARFTDNKVHPFFGGFVTLARMLQRKVVPVYIAGVNKVYPPNTFWVHYYPIKVTVGVPVELQKDESDAAFKERVYQWFVAQAKG